MHELSVEVEMVKAIIPNRAERRRRAKAQRRATARPCTACDPGEEGVVDMGDKGQHQHLYSHSHTDKEGHEHLFDSVSHWIERIALAILIVAIVAALVFGIIFLASKIGDHIEAERNQEIADAKEQWLSEALEQCKAVNSDG